MVESMSTLLEYLNKAEKVVEQWPEWKRKSIRDAFQLPPLNCDKEAQDNPALSIELSLPDS